MPKRPILILLLALAGFSRAQAGAPKAASAALDSLRSHIPLGVQGFFLPSRHRTLDILGSAQSSWFEGWRIVREGPQRLVLAANGTPIRQYPRKLQFRITASALTARPLDVERDPLQWNGDLNQLLLNLGFKLKVFHGLAVTTLEADSIELVGMPADIAYDERIYRLNFTLPPVPIEDRVVLEVLDPAKERLCKFHLDF